VAHALTPNNPAKRHVRCEQAWAGHELLRAQQSYDPHVVSPLHASQSARKLETTLTLCLFT